MAKISLLTPVLFIIAGSLSPCDGTNDVFDIYVGLHIDSGLMIESYVTGMTNREDAVVVCLMKCKKNAGCSMVTLESLSSFVCSFWTFNKTHDVSPSRNANSTLYTKKNLCQAPYAPLRPFWFGCYFFNPEEVSTLDHAYDLCRQHSGGKSASLETQAEFGAFERAIVENTAYSSFASYILGTVRINSMYHWQSDNSTQLQTWGWKGVTSQTHGYGHAILFVVSQLRFAGAALSDFAGKNVSTICEWPK